jgi:hypothetical protein
MRAVPYSLGSQGGSGAHPRTVEDSGRSEVGMPQLSPWCSPRDPGAPSSNFSFLRTLIQGALPCRVKKEDEKGRAVVILLPDKVGCRPKSFSGIHSDEKYIPPCGKPCRYVPCQDIVLQGERNPPPPPPTVPRIGTDAAQVTRHLQHSPMPSVPLKTEGLCTEEPEWASQSIRYQESSGPGW